MAVLSDLRLTLRRCAAALAWSASALAAAAGPGALVTIVDGPARVVEGVRTLAAAEGMRLAEQTLIETSPSLRLLRVEWPDGTVADFGPDTRAMLAPAGFGLRDKRPSAFYLLRGWAKQSALGTTAAAGHVSLAVDVQPFKGALVSFAGPNESWVFAESGSAQVVERQLKTAVRQPLGAGEVYNRAGLDKGAVAPRPTPAQLQRVPRGFRDSLPLRSAAFAAKVVQGKPLPLPTYTELREWLTAEPLLRKDFPQRFAARAREPAFRDALLARIGEHPEWDRLLHPERSDESRRDLKRKPATPAAAATR